MLKVFLGILKIFVLKIHWCLLHTRWVWMEQCKTYFGTMVKVKRIMNYLVLCLISMLHIRKISTWARLLFSGVNHHNQTIIFATTLVLNEVEGTYVWLLEHFLVAMKGKTLIYVITDNDVAMRNAIKKVFPYSYHRLCEWHLLQNAISNVDNPNSSLFSKNACLVIMMFGNLRIYERIW